MSAPDEYRDAIARFARAIRDPESSSQLNVETRRLKIYQDLFFNNLNNFLSNNFPVFKSLMPDDWWDEEVRRYLQIHRCESPLFSHIGREYLDYVNSSERPTTPEDPPFMAELLHYEWVELALQIAPGAEPSSFPNPSQAFDAGAALPRSKGVLDARPRLSPVAWPLEYAYPVHQIGPSYQPQEPPEKPTWILVYRNRDQRVSFVVLNAFTARLLGLMQESSEQGRPRATGRQLLERLQKEAPGVDPEALMTGGEVILQEFYDLGVLYLEP